MSENQDQYDAQTSGAFTESPEHDAQMFSSSKQIRAQSLFYFLSGVAKRCVTIFANVNSMWNLQLLS